MVLWSAAFVSVAFVESSPSAALQLALVLAVIGPIKPIAASNAATLRQAVTPEHMLGRMMALNRMSIWGDGALGSIAGGLVAGQIGLQMTAVLGGALPFIGGLVILCSPLKRCADSTP